MILIFRHTPTEGPGYLAEFLERRSIAYRVLAIDAGERLPALPSEARGLVFMGGPMSVNDPLPWIADALRLIRQASQKNIPLLGHCLGGQLISKALGGTIAANPVKEIGWLPVEKISSPVADEWMSGLPNQFEAFHWHGETFTVPEGATRILQSADCANQAYVLGNILGFQFHVEMTETMVNEWASVNEPEIARPSRTVQSAAEMKRDLKERVAKLNRVADAFYSRWIRMLNR